VATVVEPELPNLKVQTFTVTGPFKTDTE